MTIMTKNTFIFLSGLGIGGLVGYLVTKKLLDDKYFKKYDDRAKELEGYYGSIKYYDPSIDKDLDEKEEHSKDEEKKDQVLSKDQKNEIRRKLLNNSRRTTNYAEYYRNKRQNEPQKEDLADSEHPEDDEPEDEEDDYIDENGSPEEERAFEEHQKNRNRPPRIISAEAIGELGPEWDEKALMYYFYDGTLTTEDDGIIDDEALLIGDALDKYGFSSNEDEMVIYVQNFALQTVYEVQKVMARFDE